MLNMQAPFQGLWGKFCLFLLKTRCAERERGAGGMHPSPPSASRLLQKQPMTDSVGTNCSDLPNISKVFQGTQGRGLLPLASYIQCSNRAGS